MAPKLGELRAMSDEELERLYDETAASTVVGLEWFREEVRQRAIGRQTEQIVRLTWAIAVMTGINVVVAAALLVRAP